MTAVARMPLAWQVRGSKERITVARVLDLIRRRRGRENAISMHEIAATTGIETRTIQAVVKFLVEERHQAIGTAAAKPFGYFWIVSEDERRQVRDHFVRRAISTLKHAEAFDSDSIVAPLVGQIEMDFPKEEQQ